MALRDEQADILGGPILQRPDSRPFASFSLYHPIFKSASLLGLALLVCIVCVRGFEHLRKHRELGYRKAMRRKHGIPDSDCRPFAVAYAAAKRAHLEREAQDRKKTANYVSNHNLPAVDQRTDAQNAVRGMRRRVPGATLQLYNHQLPDKYDASYDINRPEVHSLDFEDRHNPNPRRRVTVPEQFTVEKSPVHRTSRRDLIIHSDTNEESRKRSFEYENDVEHEILKRSRIDGDELMNGDRRADWYAQHGGVPPPRRTLQESQPTDDCVDVDGQERSKCVNDFHEGDHELIDEAMEGATEVEEMRFKAGARGKKRDRAEAESCFGGDDDDDIRNGRLSCHRKRRTISRRRIEVPGRGQKRDREAESPESESDGNVSELSRRPVQRISKKRRGKKAMSDEVSETSVEESQVSKDPLCNGRKVGDEWEVDGVRYKVGDKGERLRLTLVKKARSKYHMPQDSQHPDRSAALEIYVEIWMTDEQYKQAEGKQELAWQEARGESSGPKTLNVLNLPVKNGKNLLWDSIKTGPARRPLVLASTSTRINPFEQRQLQPALSRRVASSSTVTSPMLPGVTDSPTRPGFRAFSRWEKQDREAEALARIRAKMEEQRKAQAPSQKLAEIPTSVTAPELGSKLLPVPTITLTPAPNAALEGGSNNSILQSKLNTLTPSVTPPSTGDSLKNATAGAPTTSASFLPTSTSAPASTSSVLFSGTPATTTSTVSLSMFSFAKPLQAPLSSTTVSPPAMPDPGGASTPSVSALSPFTASVTTQPPSMESFTKPDASSSVSPPVVPTAKFPASNFSATSMTIGSTLPAAKAEAPVPPPVSTSPIALESSKQAAPLFSFSSATPLSTSTQPPLPASAPPPKFSFGQPPTTSTFMTSSSLASGTSPQSKPTFKFGPTLSRATDSDSAPSTLTADESKKSAVLASVFSTANSSNEPAKSSPFGTSVLGNSTMSSPPALASNFSAKPVAVDGGAKPLLSSSSTTTPNNALSSTPAGVPVSPVFSFGGTNSSSESKPTTLSGGAAGGSKLAPIFGGNSLEKKPTFTLNTSFEGSKPTSIFGGNTEGFKKPTVFGGSAENPKTTFAFGGPTESSKPSSTFGGNVEGPKSMFAFGATTEIKSAFGSAAENSISANVPKPTATSGITTFGQSSPSTFGFGKDGTTISASPSAGTQQAPAVPFTFGVASGATLTPAQPTSDHSSQSIFGRPTSPNTFGFVGSGSSSSPSMFPTSKPAAPNQNQEQ